MRIGVDGTVLMGEPAGLGYYARSLLTHMVKDAGHEWVVFSPGPVDFELKKWENVGVRAGKLTIKPLFAAWQQFVLPLMITSERLDLFWSPHHYLPLLTVKVPMVCTIHDMVYAGYPEDMSALRLIAEKTLLPPSVKKAARVITDSIATEKDIYRYVPAAKGKVSVIHLGPVALAEGVRPCPVDMGIHSPYILFVGSRQRRKNLRRLIEAFLRLPEDVRSGHQLVITGKHAYGEDFHDIYNEADLADKLIFTGYVDRQTLTDLLKNARILAIVSLMEGFGLPVLEAMAANVPVLCSNVSSLPEVAGDAALYVDPIDVDSISTGLLRLLTDEALRRDLAVRGVKRLSKFSWESSAQKTMDVFLDVIGKSRSHIKP